ncbi:MAG TPA: hypothetical protein PL182_12715 [Pseudobdellovibrionaceae bacterium]|nr:hypothetical protein [Pseudobdellovibrionaceae bacterium]
MTSHKFAATTALFAAVLFGGALAHAQKGGGLFVEPLLQYEDSKSEIKSSQLPLVTDDSSGTLKGPGLGLRLGGHVADIVFIAADARYMKTDLNDSFYEKAAATGYNYGVTLGAQTPLFGIRVWGTAVLGGELDPEAGVSDLDLKFKDAKGHRVGAGIHFAAVAVNLEYQDLKYDKTEIQSWGSLTANNTTDVDSTQKGLILSVGFPIEL